MNEQSPRVSIVIPCYTEKRWKLTTNAIQSALAQGMRDVEVVVVVDHNDQLAARLRHTFTDLTVVENSCEQGASGNRNSGAKATQGEILAFLDDDHVAAPTWAEQLCQHIGRSDVIGVGGHATPAWPNGQPRWFPDEFAWVVGASYRGLPTRATPVRNVWSGNMAIERQRFDAVGGFRVGFGKLGQRSRPEDTDFCIRVRHRYPGLDWIYEPRAVIDHVVPPRRATALFFFGRCWAEGMGKAELGRAIGADATTAERDYVRRVLPAGAVQGLGDAFRRGDWSGLARTGAIVGGLALTSGGLAAGHLTARWNLWR